MRLITRRKQILDIIQENEVVEITDLAEKLQVSAMTIRRDLALFAKQGLVTLTYGGAVINKGASIEPTYFIKQEQMVIEKQNIGKAAAALIKEGDAIFIDCGTTAKEVAEELSGMKNITVITNSLLAANVLCQSPEIKLVMAPGTFREKSMGFIGQVTAEFVHSMMVDYVFLGVEGIDRHLRATVPDIDDGEMKRVLVKRARNVVVIADHTKIGKTYLMTVAAAKEISTIVTGQDAPKDFIDEYRSAGIDVILV